MHIFSSIISLIASYLIDKREKNDHKSLSIRDNPINSPVHVHDDDDEQRSDSTLYLMRCSHIL